MHIIATTQIRNDTPGRASFHRELAEGRKPKEARCVVKRRVSDAVYRHLTNDAEQAAGPGGQRGTTLQSSVTDPTPTVGSSDKPLPGPGTDTTTPLAATA